MSVYPETKMIMAKEVLAMLENPEKTPDIALLSRFANALNGGIGVPHDPELASMIKRKITRIEMQQRQG